MMMPSSTAKDDDAKLHMSTNPPTPPLSETRGPLDEPTSKLFDVSYDRGSREVDAVATTSKRVSG